MQRLAKFLKDLLIATDPPRLPATSSEMSLHDALRICAGHIQDGGVPELAWTASRQINVCWYRSESDLHAVWHCFDDATRHAARLAVVLVLGDFLRGNLRELIRQRRHAHRLVIVPHPGHWPGMDSFGDLALAPGALGWNSIELWRDLHTASGSFAVSSGQDERLFIILPANTPARTVV